MVDGRCAPRSGTHLLRNAAKERRRKLFGLKLVPTYLVDGTLCEMRLEHILPRLLHPVFHINARSSNRCVFYTDFLFFPLPQASSSCWRSQREIGDVLLAYSLTRILLPISVYYLPFLFVEFYVSLQTDGNFQLDLQSR